jgi:hypothetical protein
MLSRGDIRFRYFLAERLGMTVGEIDEKVSRAELIGWMAHTSLCNDEHRIAEHNGGVK